MRIKDSLVTDNVMFIRNTTFKPSLDVRVMSDEFRGYLARRNENVDLAHSHRLVV